MDKIWIEMFEGGFSGITHIDVSGLNTSSVTNMAFMFVGCGRCLSRCPVSMNIVKVMKALEEK